VDQYDVFLLQASGRKRWQVAQRFDGQLMEDCEISVLQHFDPEQEWLLEAGDLLYLPPGVAHYGLALEAGMTWSIGMRAPSAADLFQAFGEWLATQPDEGGRYRDPDLARPDSVAEVDRAASARFQGLLKQHLQTEAPFQRFLGAFLSSYRLAQQVAPPDRAHDSASLRRELAAGARLRHHPWTRILWLPAADSALLFASGDVIPGTRDAARLVSDPGRLRHTSELRNGPMLDLCLELLNRGHLYLSES
jgi:50S ribosomal protein L16 3-hydroxylase